MSEIFLRLATHGDVFVLWVLILASVLSVGVMVERWRTYARASRGDVLALFDGLAEKLENQDLSGALALARDSGRVEGRVAYEGLRSFAKGSAAVEEVMASRWIREKLELEKYLIVLNTLGNNAPFIGLFGTVLGIIKAFNDLALSGQSGVAVVMAGIPAVVANNIFVTRLRRMQANTDSLSRILLAYLKTEH
jgi:biopolymer transport protein ExbB